MMATRLFRRFAQSAALSEPSSSSQSAWSLLLQRIATEKPSDEEIQIIRKERPWATAPNVLCLYKSIKRTASHSVNIRWPTNPERNLDVIMPEDTNFYSLQVYAVFYGLLSAHQHGEQCVSLYSENKALVKVGNGVFKAHKEKKVFDRIQRRVCDNDVIMARLSELSPSVLQELGIEKLWTLKAEKSVSEANFRDTHSSALIMV